MEIINGKALSEMCDYSFGDQMGSRDPDQITGGFMKPANRNNGEFAEAVREHRGEIMTLFIDNLRLYPRTVEVAAMDAAWVTYLMQTNDLLKLCSHFPDKKFVIFTSLEDMPIDDQIVIPENVLGIHAVNAAHFGGKIHPFPYGLQRPINRHGDPEDNRLDVMRTLADVDAGLHHRPTKLLYVNCGVGRHESRKPLLAFEDREWATCRFDRHSMYFTYDRYAEFLTEMMDHSFMACPEGHGMDCHRNWELLYLRRVPVMLDTPYFRRLMDGYPVLFIDKWEDISEEMLLANVDLVEEAMRMDRTYLDLRNLFDKIIKSYENNNE